MSRPTTWCALLLAVLLVSGHTAGLQLVAWAGMLVERTPTMGFAQALRSTVDGSAPCAVCRVVDHFALAQQDAAKQQPGGTQTPAPAMPAPHLAPAELLTLPVTVPILVARLAHADPSAPRAWIGEVPVPPPRNS